MIVGVFADTHDHLDNIRRVVQLFNDRECDAILFAGDLVSTFAVPPLRALNAPIYGVFGDNEGNRTGIVGGFRLIGEIREAPASYILTDGTRVVIAHMPSQLKDFVGEFDVAVHGHTHKPSIKQDQLGRLILNPGETSGWTYGCPTVLILDTATMQAEIIPLDITEPLPSWDQERRTRAAANSRNNSLKRRD